MEKWQSVDNYVGEDFTGYYVLYSKTDMYDPIAQSNFDAIILELDSKKIEYEQVTFKHWACGHVYAIMIHESDEEAMAYGHELERRLDDYPILDEEDYQMLRDYQAHDLFFSDQEYWCKEAGVEYPEGGFDVGEGVPAEVMEYMEEGGYLDA